MKRSNRRKQKNLSKKYSRAGNVGKRVNDFNEMKVPKGKGVEFFAQISWLLLIIVPLISSVSFLSQSHIQCIYGIVPSVKFSPAIRIRHEVQHKLSFDRSIYVPPATRNCLVIFGDRKDKKSLINVHSYVLVIFLI